MTQTKLAFNQINGNVVSVLDFGADPTGVADSRAALAAADTDGDFTVPSGTYLVNSNITISNNITFQAGGILKPASGVTITLNKSITAGDYQVFDVSAGGSITIAQEPKFAKSVWFGVFPSTIGSETDISSEMQAAIDSVGDNGCVEVMPHRTSYFYHVASKITMNYNQLGIYCLSRIARFRANTDITILEQTGSKFGLYMRNLQLDNGLAAAGSNSSLVLSISSLFHLENIYVEDGPKHNFFLTGLCNEGRLIGCTSENARGGDGFNLSSSAVMVKHIDCTAIGSANSGFNSATGSGKYGNKFIGCISYSNEYHGFSLAGDGDEASGCHARNNSQDTPDTYSGIALAGTGSKVIGGTFIDDQGSPTQKHGVRKSGPSQVVIGISGSGNVSELVKRASGFELTIATGAITVNSPKHIVDTEADAASDDLDTINGGYADYILILSPANTARTVVVKDGTGNLRLAGDFTMDNSHDHIMLYYDDIDNAWYELSRSDNGA